MRAFQSKKCLSRGGQSAVLDKNRIALDVDLQAFDLNLLAQMAQRENRVKIQRLSPATFGRAIRIHNQGIG